MSSPLTLGTRSIGRLLVQYSIPAIIASVAVSVYNIVDSIFIGQGVGAMAIAGLAIDLPLMNLVIAFCTLVAAGGAAISSIFMGQKDLGRATDVVNNSIVLCLIHAVVFGGLMIIFINPLLRLFGATDVTIGYAGDFLKVILWCTPISFIFIGLNNLMRATGYPKKAMISALITVVVNVALCPLFIYKFNMGIAGAAWATIAGQTVGCVWVTWHFLDPKSFVHFDMHRQWFTPSIIKRIYSIGLSPFLMNTCACVVVMFLNRALLDCPDVNGNVAVGAYGILNRVTMFFVMVVFGITQGMQPILGYNYGAGQWLRVKKTLRMGIWIGTAVTVVGYALTQLMPDQISRLFTHDQAMVDLARTGCHIYFFFYPIVGAQIVIQNYFQSIGHPLWSIVLSLTRQLVFLLPFLWILPHYYGVDGVWASMSGSDLSSFFVAMIIMYFFNRHQTRLYDQRIKSAPAS